MMTLKTIRRFYDNEEKVTREKESIFEASDERANFLIEIGMVKEIQKAGYPEDAEKNPDIPEEEPEKPTKKETRKPKIQTPED